MKGLLALDINIKASSIQLSNTSSFRISIKLFTNSSNGEEKMNLPLPEKLPLGTLIRKVAWLMRVCKIKDKLQLKEKRRKMQ
jgi:hypothetical protein